MYERAICCFVQPLSRLISYSSLQKQNTIGSRLKNETAIQVAVGDANITIIIDECVISC